MKMYGEMAAWWPLLSAPAEYEDEARQYMRLLSEHGGRPVREVLELGSGGGNNASHLKASFAMTLVEPSEGMRRISRALNPECAHVDGDMRTVRLGRAFDAVFVHDAVSYMVTEADLAAAIRTVAAHLAPGGVALVVPDATAETFRPGHETGGHDASDGRGLRFLEWTLPPAQPGATWHDVHYVIALRESDGRVRVVHDPHRHGLFSRATWLRLFRDAGLEGRLVGSDLGEPGHVHDLFVAEKR